LRRLIVNADDFGLHTGINAGVAACHREGIVTSASLCPNGAAFDDAVRVVRETPGLHVGVHLTLVGEAPLSDPGAVPTLAPDGRLPPYFTVLFRRLLLRRVREADLESEIVAQVARARDAGVRVSHLDSHQHVHLHPSVLPVVLRVASRFGISRIRAASRVVPVRSLRPALLALFARSGARRVLRAGMKTPDTFLGMAETGALGEARLLRLLSRLPAGTSELVCHPGHGGDAIAASYPDWGFRWDEEAKALTSPRVKELLAREGVELVGYGDL
jgi:hopanoid biosynthesis associated protein HpnK